VFAMGDLGWYKAYLRPLLVRFDPLAFYRPVERLPFLLFEFSDCFFYIGRIAWILPFRTSASIHADSRLYPISTEFSQPL